MKFDNSKERLFILTERLDNTFKPNLNEIKKSDKRGHHVNIEKETLDNNNFRKVLYTGEHLQLVLMTLKP